MMKNPYSEELKEALFASVAKILGKSGKNKELEILASANASFDVLDKRDAFIYSLTLTIPIDTYVQIEPERKELEGSLLKVISSIADVKGFILKKLSIRPELVMVNGDWRTEANEMLFQELTNQGRIRTNRIAPLTQDGLLFRSQPEINLYKALKVLGVSFMPLPVVLRGGEEYKRIEPDFLIFKDGILLVVEVDGNSYHFEKPYEANERVRMLIHEGAILERVLAEECRTEELARDCALNLIKLIDKLKSNR